MVNAGYDITSLHLYAVIHDTVLASGSAKLELHGILACLQACIEEIGGEDIVSAAVQCAAIYAGIVHARLPSAARSTVDGYGNLCARAAASGNGGSEIYATCGAVVKVELDGPSAIVACLGVIPVFVLLALANGIDKAAGHFLPHSVLAQAVAEHELIAPAVVLTYHPEHLRVFLGCPRNGAEVILACHDVDAILLQQMPQNHVHRPKHLLQFSWHQH